MSSSIKAFHVNHVRRNLFVCSDGKKANTRTPINDVFLYIPVGTALVFPSPSHPHVPPHLFSHPARNLVHTTRWRVPPVYNERQRGRDDGGGAHRVRPISHWQTSLRLLPFPYCARYNLGCEGRREGGTNKRTNGLHAPLKTTYGTAVFCLLCSLPPSRTLSLSLSLSLSGRPQNKNIVGLHFRSVSPAEPPPAAPDDVPLFRHG